MSEIPDGIPQDVWEAAAAAWQCADNREDRGEGSIFEIARAILAERERCAKVADEAAKRYRGHGTGLTSSIISNVGGSVADSIASAIRSSHE